MLCVERENPDHERKIKQGNNMDHTRNSIWEAARRTVLEIRFDTEGRPLNRPVRTVSAIKPARRIQSRRAAEAVR